MRLPSPHALPSKAFTITEMMVVLAIIVVACGMATAAIGSMSGGNPALSTAYRVQGSLLKAQGLAMKTGRQHSVTFNNFDSSSTFSRAANQRPGFLWHTPATLSSYDLNSSTANNPAQVHKRDHQWWQIIDHRDGRMPYGQYVRTNNYTYHEGNQTDFELCRVGPPEEPDEGAAFLALSYRDGYYRGNDFLSNPSPYDMHGYGHFYHTTHDWTNYQYLGRYNLIHYQSGNPVWSNFANGYTGDFRYEFDPSGIQPRVWKGGQCFQDYQTLGYMANTTRGDIQYGHSSLGYGHTYSNSFLYGQGAQIDRFWNHSDSAQNQDLYGPLKPFGQEPTRLGYMDALSFWEPENGTPGERPDISWLTMNLYFGNTEVHSGTTYFTPVP